MDPAKLVDWIKLSPRHVLAVFLASAFLAFAPEAILGDLGLTTFRNDYRVWVGVPTVVSGALLATHMLREVWRFARVRSGVRAQIKRWERRLHDLTPEERAVLRCYLENDTRTQRFPLDDGAVQELVSFGVLRVASSLGTRHSFAYNIQPWAWDYLRANPRLLAEPGDGNGAGPHPARA